MSTLNCSVNFPLTVEDKIGRMVTANPAVTLVEVALSEYHNQEKGGHNHTELFAVKSLLYTAEEVAEYEQILLGPGGDSAILKLLLQGDRGVCPIPGHPGLQVAATAAEP